MNNIITEIKNLQNKEYKLFNKLNNITAWTQKPGSNYKNISSSGKGYIWAVDNNNDVFMCKKPCNGNWSQKGGKMVQISGGQNKLWGVSEKTGWLFNRNIDGTESWNWLGGNYKDVTNSSNGYVWMLENNNDLNINNIYRCKKPCDSLSTRELIPGHLDQLSSGQNEVWGVNSLNDIYKRNENDNKWTKIPGKLKWISASNPNYIVGVNSSNDIWQCKKPCDGKNWVQLPGKLNKISSDNKNAVGLMNGNIYKKIIGDKIEEQNIITEINKLSNTRMSLFKSLNNNYNNLILDVSNTKQDFDRQIKLTNVSEDNLNKIKNNINKLIEDKNYKLRNVEINTYYSNMYHNYFKLSSMVLLFSILFIILGILSRYEILPTNIIKIITTLLLIILIVIILLNIFNINSRNNMNYDEFDTYTMSNNQNIKPLPKSLTSSKKSLNGLNIGTCVGSSCCSTGTTYDNKINKCV